MIKTGMKTFWKNLIFVFIPMGIIYLFLLLTVFLLFYSIAQNLVDTLGKISDLISTSTEQSSASVNEFLSYSFDQLKWNGNIIDYIRQIFDTNWLKNTFEGFFQTLDMSTEGFSQEFTAIINNFSRKLKLDFEIGITFTILGIVLANYVTRFAVRKRNIKRNIKKFVIAHTLVPIMQSIVVIAALVLLAVLKLYGILAIVAILALYGVVSIMSSWLIHRNGTLSLKQVLTAKNVFSHLAVVGIIALINIALFMILVFINPILAILLELPFAIYSFTIADMTCESYVISLLNPPKPKDIKSIDKA